ncbi:MAG: 3-oxoacyl-ACP synthase [Bdellovibrionales bacterium]|nr:3-oxoacyl-ACP synthase [Bdellovibrionales bacterium]
MKVFLNSAAVYLPEQHETAEYIHEQSGVPLEVVQKKMGIIKKCRAPESLHPSEMAVRAAKVALKDIDPHSIDLVIWSGSEYKDYPVWSAGIFVQRELGLKKAYAFDASARCSSNVLALKLAKSLMQTDEDIQNVLICGGHKTGDLVNYRDQNARFLYNLSDGGSAMVLSKKGKNEILESSFITDGDFSLDVIIPGGGTKNPTRQGVKETDTYLQVPDVAGMRERLEAKSLSNFVQVVKQSAIKSMSKPIDYLALLHMKRSAHDALLSQLELKQEQSIYLDHYGHFGAPDQVLSLGLAERRNLLKEGSHVVLASAGIGYTWSALSIDWQEACFKQSTLDDFEK